MAITMEELRQKARAYDKVREKIALRFGSNVAEEIFSEFEMNKDERIRKDIISYLHNEKKVKRYISDIEFDKWIAWLEKQSQEPKKVSIWKHWKDGIAGNGEGEDIYLIKIGNTYKLSSCLSFECDYIELSNLDNLMFEKPQCKKPKINESETNGECIGESITMKLEKAIAMKLEERNEQMAQLMLQLGLCERRGSGVDRAVEAMEKMLLPAYKAENGSDFTRVTLYPKKSVSDLTKEERIEACYQHCCLAYADNETMNNQSVRERFGLNKNQGTIASHIIAY